MARGLLLLGALVAAGCGGCSGGYQGPAAVRAFPVGDCDADGVEDYATAILFDEYSDSHPSDRLHLLSGKSGRGLGDCDLGFSPRHAPHVLWSGSSLETLALLDRRSEMPPVPHPLVRMGCSEPTDFLAELGRPATDGSVVGLGLRSAMDGLGGVFVVVCSLRSTGADGIACVLYRWSHGKASELKRYTFKGDGHTLHLACTVGHFEGDSTLDLAIGEPGRNSAAGAIHLIDGGSGEQRVLLEGRVSGGLLGLRVEALRALHAGEPESLVLGAIDSSEPGRARGLLFACSPASPGERIWSVGGASDFSGIDRGMRILSDCDGDGVEDVSYIDGRGESALIVSGRTGSRILQIPHPLGQEIESIVPCADQDGDGRLDFLLGARLGPDPEADPNSLEGRFASCVVVSSSDGRTLQRFSVER